MPEGGILRGDGQKGWYVEDGAGKRCFPAADAMSNRLATEHEAVGFRVLYIGQAFGENGSRNALDRLKKHETLQKIALKGTPPGYNMTVLMLDIKPSHQLFTFFNPNANDSTQGPERIESGLSKLFDTDEAERFTLYEASLIRYLQPEYNIEFKNSFPCTNLKVLKDCYSKDFAL